MRIWPTSAFRFAPSPYISPPALCTISLIFSMFGSNSPSVLGTVSMMPATRSDRLASSVARSILPSDTRLERHHLEACCRRRGRVRAVRRVRHEDDIAIVVAARPVISAYHQYSRELALRARRGLKRHSRPFPKSALAYSVARIAPVKRPGPVSSGW